MKVGTKSVLFGAHCFFIHPWFVAVAWWRLYGFPLDPRLWIAFIIHDWGYWEKANMDGDEGEMHVVWAANLMGRWFGIHWENFCLYHSRYWAKRNGTQPSKLCYADKLAITYEPWWLYLPRVNLSGEIHEYMALAKSQTDQSEPKYASMKLTTSSQKRWFFDVCEYLQRWVAEHKDGKWDMWTPNTQGSNRQPEKESGVWK